MKVLVFQRHLKIVIIFMRRVCNPNTYEPLHKKTDNLHMQNKGTDQIRSNWEADLSALLFAKRIVQFLSFLNLKFPASIHLLCLYRPVQTWSETRKSLVSSCEGSYILS